MPYEPPPYLAELSLAEIANQVEQRKLPPVEKWAPQKLGDSFMRIAADGTWYHEGDPIRRPAMVRAFSGLLTRDDLSGHRSFFFGWVEVEVAAEADVGFRAA